METDLLHICCNHHENGSFAARVFGVHVGEIQLDVRVIGAETRCRTLKAGRFSIGRVAFKTYSYREWVGNWCWDAMRVRRDDIVRILNYLRDRRCREWQVYSVESGPEEFWAAWSRESPLTIEDIYPAVTSERS